MVLVRAAAALALLLPAGCSTIADTFQYQDPPPVLSRPGPNIMGGVRTDYVHMGDTGCKAIAKPIFFFDFPFSFVMDVAFLPFTVPYNLLRPGLPSPEQSQKE